MTTAVRSGLLLALQKPMEIKEAADQLAIPTMYVEEEIKGLMELEAVSKLPGNKYAADFIIQTMELQRQIAELAKEYAPSARLKLQAKFDQLKDRLAAIGFGDGETSWEELRYSLLLHMVHDSGALFSCIPKYDPPLRPDGGRYYFLCRENDSRLDMFEIHDWYDSIPGVQSRACSLGKCSIMEKLGAPMADITAWCKQIHDTGGAEGVDTEIIARLITAGLIIKSGNRLKVAVPWLSLEQYDKFLSLAAEFVPVFQLKLEDFRNQVALLLEKSLSPYLHKHIPMQKVWVGFDLLKEIMRPIWPEDARSVAGLFFAETPL